MSGREGKKEGCNQKEGSPDSTLGVSRDTTVATHTKDEEGCLLDHDYAL